MKQLLLVFILIGLFLFSHSQLNIKKAPDEIPQLSTRTPGPATKIFIRCGMARSYNDTPLYIIDGVPVEYIHLRQLNPNDIECIDVLKESATALFGCRASKGVILITTKQSSLCKIQVKDSQTRTGIPYATIILKKKNANISEVKTLNRTGILYYKIHNANIDSVLISSVGYETALLSFSNFKQNNYVVFLKKKEKYLEEVIVTGYSVTRRSCYGSFCTVTRCKFHSTPASEQLLKSNTIKAFPNPVLKGATVNLNFGNSKPGVYQIRLLNSSGQLFYSFQIQISSKNETEQIHLNEKIRAGLYFVQVIDEKKKLVQTMKLIVQ